MTVPFEKLGPGQSARLAWQILGKNGPIFNPNNILYLPTEGMSLTAGPACELVAGLAGVTLAVSVGTLALSAATFLSVQKLHKKMDTALSMLGDIKAQLDEITARTRRIDVTVAEDRLRQAMKHVFRKAICEDRIDLTELIMLKNDLQNLFDTLKDGIFLNFSISLSTDVRDNLYYLYSLLFNLRHTIAWHHNRATNGDPSRTITITPTSDYIDDLTMIIDKTIVLHKKVSKNRDKLIGNVKLWIEGSDAGLMYRTYKELQGLEEGYQKVFWKSLPVTETPLGDIKVCHEFSTSE